MELQLLKDLVYKPFGERAILMEWEATIDLRIISEIYQLKKLLLSNFPDVIEDVVIAYHSLTLMYKERINDYKKEIHLINSCFTENKIKEEDVSTLWKIPVCYDEFFGFDLKELATSLNLSMQKLIKIHSQTLYTVYFIGFLPGFLYLGGLDERLKFPRKATPRLSVPQGALAIGGSQTGIYPIESAGGWNIIGKTPISFFDVEKENPCFAKPGDRIQFIPISLEVYKNLEDDIDAGLFNLSNTLIDA